MRIRIEYDDGVVMEMSGDEAIEKIRSLWADVDRKMRDNVPPEDNWRCKLTVYELDHRPGDRFAWNGINMLRGPYGAKYGYSLDIVH